MPPKPSAQSIKDLVSGQAGAAVGLKPTSSSIVVANLNATVLPACVGVAPEEIDTDNNIVLCFVLDQSPSMMPVEQEVISTFNDLLIPALKGASKRNAQSLLIGGFAFNETVTPLWGGGFQRLEDLPKLTRRDYNTHSGSRTALYQATLDGLTATTAYAASLVQGTGIVPRIIVVVISDGANNCNPYDASDVRRVAKDLSIETCKLAFAGFESGESVNFHDIAQEMGFEVFESKIQGSETEADTQRRFRHLINVVSSSIVTASTTKVGGDNKSQPFWQNP